MKLENLNDSFRSDIAQNIDVLKNNSPLEDSSNGSISFVLGKGLVAGVIFGDPNSGDKKAIDNCNRIAELCFQRGLLVVHTGRESIKLAPTLDISEEALIEGLDVFRQCVNDVIV